MTAPVAATISAPAAGARRWDVLVVGAGPAGSAAALGLASTGLDVLLVDRAAFPRWKVCGGCLSAGAVRLLHELGVMQGLPANPLRELRLGAGRCSAGLPLRGGAALSREALDAALAAAAVRAGAHLLDRAAALDTRVEAAWRSVLVRADDGRHHPLEARLVLAADGVAASFAHELGSRSAHSNRLGLGCRLDPASPGVPAGVVSMTVADGGYVGAVRLEDGSINLAAAVSPATVRRAGPAGAVGTILRSAGHPLADLAESARWRGTPPLTRRRRCVAAERLLALGDSAGYAEPFTGEGITWALRCGIAAAELGVEILADRCTTGAWAEWWRTQMATEHRRCALVARCLRAGPLTRLGIGALGALPGAGASLAGLFGSGPAPAHP